MGFKCPVCFEDFGLDKEAWDNHIKNKHQGVGKHFVKIVRDIAENHQTKTKRRNTHEK